MKKTIYQVYLILLLATFSTQVYSQNNAILDYANQIKTESINLGYILLDEGGLPTNSESVISFDKKYWPIGYYYVIIAITTASCDISMQFMDYDRNELQILSPETEQNNHYKRGVFRFEKTKNTNGKFQVFSDTPNSCYVYVMLFSKTTF